MDYEKKYNEALERMRYVVIEPEDENMLQAIKETVFPELRESEDERIRKGMIRFLKSEQAEGIFTYEARQSWLAYLEKQKEETENATKTLAKILKDSAEGFRRVLKKKGIDYEVSNEFWENTAVVYSKEEDVEFHKWMDDLMGPTSVEETYEYKKGLEAGMKQKEHQELPLMNGDADLYFDTWRQEVPVPTFRQCFEEGMRYARRLQKDQKPAEWKDLTWKDIVELEGIINNVHYEFRNGIGQESFGKEVLEKFREYKGDKYLDEKEQKPTWSEEDEKMRNLAIEWAETMSGQFNFVDMDSTDFRKIINWLKSLRPHWRPTEEQMEALAYAIQLLDDGLSPKAAKAGEELEHLREQLKRL